MLIFLKMEVGINILKIQKVVFHLAALADIVPSIKDPKKYFQSNVVGTENIASVAIKYKVKKIIYSASSSCYGVPNKYPTSETESIKPQYPYAMTKNLGEQILMHYAKIYGIQVTSMRLFNVYGTKSRTSGTMEQCLEFFCTKIEKKTANSSRRWNSKRDFTYISDIIRCIYKMYEYKKIFKFLMLELANLFQ